MSHLWKLLGVKVVPALFVLAFFVPLTFSFVQPGNTVEIWEIQGAGHLSPLEGETVSTTGNIVIGVIRSGSNRGFYMQTPPDRDDHDDATSNAIFVITGSETPNVAPRDVVNVTGVVTEFWSHSLSLTLTSITNATFEKVNPPGGSAIAPLIIGTGGRVPPTTVIDDDSRGDPETSATFDPATDGLDFYESLEGMLVQVNNAIVVGATTGSDDPWIVGDMGAEATTITPHGGIIVSLGDFNPERIRLSDTLLPNNQKFPELNVGAHFPGALEGILNYRSSEQRYELWVTQSSTPAPSTLARETTGLEAANGQFTVATFNVENLSGQADTSAFADRAAQIVNSLKSPDLVVLEEMQDNNGERDNGVVDAEVTFQNLIQAVESAGGPTYRFVQINPQDGRDGGAPGANIRIGYLYNPEHLNFVARSGGTATKPNRVVCESGTPRLNFSPGRISPGINAFANSRKPLTAEFTFGNETLFIIAVHFNSKGGDDPLYGLRQPPRLITEAQRIQQARAVRAFVVQILDCDADANVIILGDFNDYPFSPPLQTLTADGSLHNLIELLPENEQYSYVFEGNSQLLDQILVSGNLWENHAPMLDIVHVNAEFFEQISDHDPSVARFDFE